MDTHVGIQHYQHCFGEDRTIINDFRKLHEVTNPKKDNKSHF
jgi:hypothetical protein